MVKLAVFEIEKPLEVGPDLQKFGKQSNQPFFDGGGESLDMGSRFRPQAAQSIKK